LEPHVPDESGVCRTVSVSSPALSVMRTVMPPREGFPQEGEEAVAAGKKFKKTLLPTAAIPKAQVLRETRGALKVLVEEGTGLILGAHLFCPESPEMINLVKRAMDSKIPASELAEQIYTHPTMTEAFNDLFA